MPEKTIFEIKEQNLHKVLDRQKADYVPTMAYPGPAMCNWKGMSAKEAFAAGKETFLSAMTDGFGEFWSDTTILHGCMVGGTEGLMRGAPMQYKFGPDGTTIEHDQFSLMKEDEYEQLIADPDFYVSNVLAERRYPWMFTDSMESVTATIKEYLDDSFNVWDFNGGLPEIMANKYNIVDMLDGTYYMPPIDIIFDSLRGFKNTVTDLRRRPKVVKEACDVLWEKHCGYLENTDPTGRYMYWQQMAHLPAYMSPKQFEEFYWPYQMRILNHLHEKDSKLLILLEGSWVRLFDFFKDAPKDSCVLMADDDDVKDLYKALGSCQIIEGGVKLIKTKLETKEACLDYTKEVIDTCCDGAFIFGTDKNWIAPGDFNQNLIDCYNLAHEYSMTK